MLSRRSAVTKSYPYISRLEISNFRNFGAFEADLPRNCVIVGENTSGKSNLLHALRLVLDPSLPDTYRLLRAEDFWDGLDEPFNGHSISVRVEISGLDDSVEARATLADCIVRDNPLTASLSYVFGPKGSYDENAEVPREEDYGFVVYGADREANRIGWDVRQWLSLFLLPAERDAEEHIVSARRSPLRQLLARVRPKVDPSVLDSVRQQLDEAAKLLLAEEPVRALQDHINERIQSVVGPVHAVRTKFDFASSSPEQLLRSLRLFLEEGQTRSLRDGSLGTLNVLFLCLLLQELDERQDDSGLAGMILTIEEPEAHLHPHLQRLLFKYALKRSHSTIVATHSPHIVSVSPLESLLVLQKSPKGTAVKQAPKDLTEADASDLERYIDVTRGEILFAKGVLLVEGIAEEYLVPALARNVLPDALGLDDFGISVCSVSGTDFAPYCRLIGPQGLGIPSAVITDGDPKTGKEPRSNGCVRGAKLAGNLVLEGLAKGGETDVRRNLAEQGIFVGEHELELDLISSLSSEMVESYFEITKSTKSAKAFAGLLHLAQAGDLEAKGGVLRRIEKIGKGRFGQRLAGKVSAKTEVPDYIRNAVGYVYELVKAGECR